VFLNFKAYKTSKLDSYVKSNIYKSNIFKDKYRITYNEIKDKYSGFPELNALGGPIEHSLAMIAYTEGKYNIAMNHLNTAIKQAPNQQEHIGLKAVIFELNKKLKNRDSSKFYAEKAFTQKPSLLNMYNILKLSYYREKDTISLEKLFNSHLRHRRGNSQGWVDKFNFYYSYKKDSLRASMVLDTALSIHRNNKTLLDYKKHLKFK
jgi:Tfp pilus assembly protein PilF